MILITCSNCGDTQCVTTVRRACDCGLTTFRFGKVEGESKVIVSGPGMPIGVKTGEMKRVAKSYVARGYHHKGIKLEVINSDYSKLAFS